MPKLDDKKQDRFCLEYVKDHNATQAAIRAGYSKKTARSQASRLLTQVHIAARVKELDDKINTKVVETTQLDREWVLNKYRDFVEFDARKMFGADGKLLPVQELDDKTALSITSFDMAAEIEFERDGEGKRIGEPVVHEYVNKVKVADKKGALDSIAKILGLFVDKHEHGGPDGKPIEIKDVSDKELARRLAFIFARGVKAQESGE